MTESVLTETIEDERQSPYSLDEIRKNARFIIRDSVDHNKPDRHGNILSKSGYIRYIDKDGNLIHRYAESQREIIEVYGFDIVKLVDDFPIINHGAYLTSDGLFITQLGAITSLYNNKHELLITDSHSLHRIDNIIHRFLGARTDTFTISTNIKGEYFCTKHNYGKVESE